ncbi:hypothetical protein I5Q82_15975 [Acutalibacter muris]|uniref:DUF1492 domain-containing protein n=2 Tax=Acutalibacter muris TaxID=1796620 RepID=A0A1Z2XNY8_9FIRM|nr:hypothetical protein [Acutalibacter muris]ANU53095.1 hypothetical protein A4V00_03120 [Hungateiclostridiaceae bacterium KB18]ANU53187.1 hypothetical protein A4V00_03615 [Hungateiclostridiaceae bacterium KB18]ASB40140.1 hypothetical protein ADH66_05385 [Acutalibacter muris]ASB40229.1 hypothetical protein ADH66_05885 [Acutalibacter muris]QQR29427.1 hypothetical protein I5Q82_15470 [Acutalibacter muris]
MQNPNEKMTYEQQEAQIAEKSQAFINLLTQRGILANPKVTNEKIRAARQKKDRDSYHNTLLLLQNYRTLVWVMECFPETVAEELDRPFSDVDELLEQMDLQLAMGNRKLENQLEGAKKSRLLLDRVNDALTVLKHKPNNGKKLYRLIYLTYIAPEQLSHTELLYRLDMSSRHYYRLRQQAITILSIRLWSVPSAEVDLWLDMLEFLEGLE